MIGGLGSGSNSVASMSMVIAEADKNDKVRQVGLIETTTGVGFLFGPVWGSVMYQVGGYPAPFACSALLYIICFPFVTYNLFTARRLRLEK